MTSYLARLAARAGGEPAAASPRVPSRFEPIAAGGRTAASSASGAAHELRPEHRLDVDDRGARELQRTAHEGRDDARDSAGGTEPDAAGGPRQAARRRPSNDRVGARSGTDAMAAVVSAPDAALASTDGFPATARPATATTSPLTSSVAASAGRGLDAASAASAPRPRSAAAPRSGRAPAADRSGPTGRTERVDRDDGPDVVQVTIDRVEVRATVAAPAVARAASGADAHRESVQSLHDYLAGRSR